MLRQLNIFEQSSPGGQLPIHPALWDGCFNARENSIHQLSPYVGKMKSGMARALVEAFSRNGDVVLDPFCGSGVVPYEAALAGRHAVGNDLNPYAFVLTRAKLFAPETHTQAVERALKALDEAAEERTQLDEVPRWVREFFHPHTLREALALSRVLRRKREHFVLACLLGILHHVRPGFLSYPASHLVPYLRRKKYPPETYPDMYRYRPLRPRLLAKIARAYRRFEPVSRELRRVVLSRNAMSLPLPSQSVDAIISSPPYFGALDYGRDNRLRLWFLGVDDYRQVEAKLTSNEKVYVPQMAEAIGEMLRLLKPQRYAALVLGDYSRDGRSVDSAATMEQTVSRRYGSCATAERLLVDEIPDARRSRRRTRTTLQETILLIQKRG